MADRKQFYFKQTVDEDDLNTAFGYLENADRNLIADLGLTGIINGFIASQHNPTPNFTVDLSGPASAYDGLGQRIAASPVTVVDVSKDFNSVTTAVSTTGNQKYTSVFISFVRVLSDPAVDGNSQQVFFTQLEGMATFVTQGAEAPTGTATPPALQDGKLLVCDILRNFNDTHIVNAVLSTARRQDAIVIPPVSPGLPLNIREGRVVNALADIAFQVNANADSITVDETNIATLTAEVAAITGAATTAEATALGAALTNWHPAVVASGLVSSGRWNAVCYDTTYHRWIAMIVNPATSTTMVDSVDGGVTWGSQTTFSGAAGGTLLCMAAHGGGVVYVITSNISHTFEYIDTTLTGHDSASPSGVAPTQGCIFFHTASSAWVFIGADQTSGTFTGVAADSVAGTSWTSIVGGLPSSWQSGTNHVGAFCYALGVSDAIVAMCGVTAGTDTARLLHVTAGPVFADITPAILTNKIVVGVAYDAENSLYGIAAYNGTDTTIYSSPDRAVWTLVKTFAATQGVGLAVASGVWAIGIPFENATLHVAHRVWLSSTVASLGASATWAPADMQIQNLGVFDLPVAQNGLYSSGTALLAASKVVLYASNNAQAA